MSRLVKPFFYFYLEKIKLINQLIDEVDYRFFFLISLLSILENFLDLFTVGLVINIIFSSKNSIFFNGLVLNSRLNICILLIAIFLKSISKFWISIVKNRMIMNLNNSLRERIFSSAINSPLDKIDTLGKGELLNTLKFDVSKTINSFTQLVNLIRNLFTLLIFIIGFLFISNNSISILLIGFFGTFVVVFFQKSKSWELGAKLSELNESIFKIITDSIYGLKTIKSLSSEKLFLKKLSQYSRDFNNLYDISTKKDSIFNSSVDSIIAFLVVFWLVIRQEQIDSSLIIANLFLCYKVVSALSGMIQTYRMFLTSLPGFESLLKTREKILSFSPLKKSVINRFENANLPILKTFAWNYIGDRFIKTSKLELSKGKLTVMVGKSGSGKTTILDILCGLKNLELSSWYLGLKSSSKIEYTDLIRSNHIKEMLVYSTQETYLFEDNLFRNLTLGRADISQLNKKEINDEINYWFNSLGLNNIYSRFKTNSLDMKLITNCFSGGEIQRLGIMRNFLSDKPIEVYDEPTAYLDGFWSEKVSEILYKRSKNKIVLISSHDPLIIDSADQILYARDFFKN